MAQLEADDRASHAAADALGPPPPPASTAPLPNGGAAMAPGVAAWCVAAYCASFVAFGLELSVLGPTIHELAARVGVTEADLGALFTVTGALSSLGAAPSGWAVDRFPGHMVLFASLVFQAIGFVFVPRCTSFAALMVLFGVVSVTWNMVSTAGNTLVLWLYRGQTGSAVVNLLNAVFGVGSMLAPLLAERCLAWTGSSLPAYWVIAATTALCALAFLLLPSPRPPQRRAGSGAGGGGGGCDTAPAAAGASAVGGGESQELSAPLLGDDGNGSSAVSGELVWGQTAMWAVLAPASLLVFCAVGAEVAFGGWIATYAQQWGAATLKEAQLLNAGYWGAFTVGRALAAAAAHALTPATILWASMPLGVAGAALALALPASAMHGGVAWANAVLMGLGLSTAFANTLSLLDTYAHITGWVTGLLGGVSGVSCMLVPLLVAMLAKHTPLAFQGLQWTMAASYVVQAACLGLTLTAGQRLRASAASPAAQKPPPTGPAAPFV